MDEEAPYVFSLPLDRIIFTRILNYLIIIINHLKLREMKKVLFMLAAVAAFTFTSCKDSKKADTPAEGETIEEKAAEGDVQDPEQLGTDLNKALEESNGEGLKGKIDAAKEYAQKLLNEGKGEEAKGIIEKIQNFLSENTEKVTSVIGDNQYVQGALDWVKSIDAGDLINKVGEAVGVENASGKAAEAVDAVKNSEAVQATVEKGKEAVEKGKEVVEAVKNSEPAQKAAEKAQEVKDAAVQKGNEAIDAAKGAVKDAANDAVNKGIDAVGNLLK